MKDKVQKILSEIATRKLCTMDEHMAFYNDKAKEDYMFLSEIEEIIKASQEEPKKCIYALDDFNDEDRKVTCDGCEEDCKYAKLNTMLDDALTNETKESWNERLDKKDYRERYKRIAQSESFRKTYEGISIGDTVPVEGEISEEPTIPDIVDEHFYEMLGEEPVSEDNNLRKASEEYLKVLSETPYNNTPITSAQTIVRELITFLDNPSKYNPNHIEDLLKL